VTGELALIDPETASIAKLRDYAIEIRALIPAMESESELDDLDAVLVAIARRLRLAGQDAAHAVHDRVLTYRRLGEILGPGRPGDYDRHSSNRGRMPEEQQKRRWAARLFADPANAKFVDAEIQAAEREGRLISLSRMIKLCQRERSGRTVPMPQRRYAILYADPPWRYDFAETAESRQVENQYGTMSLEAIKALPVPAAADSVLFLWATSPKLPEAFDVVRAWGFTYKTCAVWVKDKIGMGYYFRQQHELLLAAVRGEPPAPPPASRPSSVISGERGEHSAKPAVVYDLIEAMYPEYERGDYTEFCELFQREPRKGWDGWGNEAP
jgi:N6-adenosine-specific RNA methylase IME4